MKIVARVGVMLAVVLGASIALSAETPVMAAQEGAALLDGKSYTGTLTSKKDGKTYEETIIFEKSMMRSTACEAMGFKGGAYTVTRQGKLTMVTGTVMNEKGDKNEIEATIKGKELTGTLTSKMADGTTGDTMTLKAKLAKKPMAAEHPAKTEHPAKKEQPMSEHPR